MGNVGTLTYLIDQQASQQLHIDVADTQRTYQPIVISEYTPLTGSTRRRLRLSREQALALAALLNDAAAQVPEVTTEGLEYPGKLV